MIVSADYVAAIGLPEWLVYVVVAAFVVACVATTYRAIRGDR